MEVSSLAAERESELRGSASGSERGPKRTSAKGENSRMLDVFDKTPEHLDGKVCCLWLPRATLASHTESSNVQGSLMWFIVMTYFGTLMV